MADQRTQDLNALRLVRQEPERIRKDQEDYLRR